MPTTQWRKHSKVGRRTKFNSSVVLHDKIIPYVFCLPQQHYSTEKGHFVLSHTIFKKKKKHSIKDGQIKSDLSVCMFSTISYILWAF